MCQIHSRENFFVYNKLNSFLMRESMFGFLDFHYQTTEFVLSKKSKIKEENACFFIFISFYADMSFWNPKRT
jgi:hypothetical protein